MRRYTRQSIIKQIIQSHWGELNLLLDKKDINAKSPVRHRLNKYCLQQLRNYRDSILGLTPKLWEKKGEEKKVV